VTLGMVRKLRLRRTKNANKQKQYIHKWRFLVPESLIRSVMIGNNEELTVDSSALTTPSLM